MNLVIEFRALGCILLAKGSFSKDFTEKIFEVKLQASMPAKSPGTPLQILPCFAISPSPPQNNVVFW